MKSSTRVAIAAIATALVVGGCTSSSTVAEIDDAAEAVALSGRPLYAPTLVPEVLSKREADLAGARARYEADPDQEENIIWLGRRTAYLGRYREAIAIYTDGLSVHPRSHRLLRHRGHRYISTRRFGRAIADLARAARLIEGVPDVIEADGMPNRLNIPTSTSHTNIYYHLGLARYLTGDFAAARDAYERCASFAKNDDMRCATWYWLYLTLRRLGDERAATKLLDPVTPDLDVIENTSYHRLLLLFKGELTADEVAGPDGDDIDDATVAYGLGMWWQLQGDRDEAESIFRRITDGPAWAAFGHIAAEAELVRR